MGGGDQKLPMLQLQLMQVALSHTVNLLVPGEIDLHPHVSQFAGQFVHEAEHETTSRLVGRDHHRFAEAQPRAWTGEARNDQPGRHEGDHEEPVNRSYDPHCVYVNVSRKFKAKPKTRKRKTGIYTKKRSMGWSNFRCIKMYITAMTLITAPLGAALAHRTDPVRLKRVFGAFLILVALNMLRKAVGW